jgi:hypothetical protein
MIQEPGRMIHVRAARAGLARLSDCAIGIPERRPTVWFLSAEPRDAGPVRMQPIPHCWNASLIRLESGPDDSWSKHIGGRMGTSCGANGGRFIVPQSGRGPSTTRP